MIFLPENLPCFYQIFFLIGVLFSLNKLYEFLCFLRRIYKPRVFILNKYGPYSYALITGGSDGIGKAFAFSLANQGFNLVLVARNLEKLESVKTEILQKSSISIKDLIYYFIFFLRPQSSNKNSGF